MFGPTLDMGKAYQNRLLEEARRARQHERAMAHTPGLQERLAMRFGNLLVDAGRRLQERYSPMTCCPATEPARSNC
jgi:hypothetical protein